MKPADLTATREKEREMIDLGFNPRTTRYAVNRHYSVAGVWQGLWNVTDTETNQTVETHTQEMEARFSAYERNGGTLD